MGAWRQRCSRHVQKVRSRSIRHKLSHAGRLTEGSAVNITNIGIRQMLLASALVMAASGEASAQSASPEQPPSEATHFAQVDSSKLSTALNGKTLIPTIEIGYKASTANPAIINGQDRKSTRLNSSHLGISY